MALWLGLPGALPAQEPGSALGEASHWNRQMLAPGLKHGSLTFTTWEGARDAVFAEVEFRYPATGVSFRFTEEGPWRGRPLVGATGENAVASALAVDTVPDLEQPATYSGLRLNENRMWSWDRRPGYQVLLHADGSARLMHRPERTAELRFEEGGAWPVVSLNGPLPEESGEVSIYTGPLEAGAPPLAAWPDELVLYTLSIPDWQGSITRALHPGTAGEPPEMVPSAAPQRRNVYLPEGELLAVLKPPAPEELEDLLARGEQATLHFETVQEERLARAVFPVSEVLLRGGEPRAEDLDRPLTGTLLGLDPAGRRLIALGQSRARRTEQSLSLHRALQHLIGEGYTEAALLASDGPALLPDVSRGQDHADAARRQVRSFLILHGDSPGMELAGTEGSMVRIDGIVVEGTRREFPLNQPGRLRDGRVTGEPDLAGFWASPAEPVDPNSTGEAAPGQARLRFLMPRPMHLHAVELVHAEAMGFDPRFNLRSYVLRGRNSRGDPWEELLRVRHDEPLPRERLTIPGSPRLSEVELLVLEPSFLPGGNVARLAEVHFWMPEEAGR